MAGTLVNFNGLLTGAKLFDIPTYQRSYAWEEDNLKDLWEDLYYLDPSKEHFFGTVLLKDSGRSTMVGMLPSTRFDVIDGQQRLTTSLILLKEILEQTKHVGDEARKKQAEHLEETFLKTEGMYKLNPQAGGDDSKIGDEKFFHNFIMDDVDNPKSHVETPSQQRLLDARDFFRSRLTEERDKLDSDEKYLDFLIGFIGKINDLQVMQYIVNSDADAIRMFETVNDRGRPLTNLEKTKSFLMHSVYLGSDSDSSKLDSDISELNSRFANIYDYYDDVGKTLYTNPPGETVVQQYHFTYTQSYNRDHISDYLNRLKDGIRNEFRECPTKGRESALKYAGELERAFLALKEIAETRDKRDDCGLGILIDRIYRVGRLANVYPLLLASWLKFQDNPKGLARILKLVEAFTFRGYIVVGFRSNTARNHLYWRAYHTFNETLDCDGIIAEMKKLHSWYTRDGRFERNLRSRDFSDQLSSYQIRYLLSEYEIELNPDMGLSWQNKMLSSTYEVEHIWPSNTSKLNLSEQEAEEHRRDLHRLGNLTVVSQADNTWLSNKPFHQKKLIFGDDSKRPRPRIQTDLVNFPDRWSAESIKQREDQIVAFALKRWSVDDV